MASILSTNHTSFTVSDLDRSIAFFEDVLGFEVTSKAPRSPEVIARVTGIKGAQVMIAYVR
ncbi:MAG: bleomycin resistance protein, partial [Acidiferrobacteraceae bacterium]|nr:bleomycin resistance protein [Acidiferrobacteraceae bacterium]